MKKRNRIVGTIILVLFALIQIIPLIWMVLFSFKNNEEVVNEPAFALPKIWRFSNYTEAWKTANMGTYFYNSFLITIIVVFATALLSCCIGYAIARMEWKLKNVVLTLFVTGIMVPLHVILIPLFLQVNRLKLGGSRLGLILPYIAVSLPFGVFVVVNFIRSIPRALEEAAVMDGCSILGVFSRIILPVSGGAISTVAIFTFLNTWNEFIMAATFINKPHLRTIPVGLKAFVGEYSVQWGPMGAAIVISCIPMLVIYIIFSEQVERSMSVSAGIK